MGGYSLRSPRQCRRDQALPGREKGGMQFLAGFGDFGAHVVDNLFVIGFAEDG